MVQPQDRVSRDLRNVGAYTPLVDHGGLVHTCRLRDAVVVGDEPEVLVHVVALGPHVGHDSGRVVGRDLVVGPGPQLGSHLRHRAHLDGPRAGLVVRGDRRSDDE